MWAYTVASVVLRPLKDLGRVKSHIKDTLAADLAVIFLRSTIRAEELLGDDLRT
jgi:hypothetical protein